MITLLWYCTIILIKYTIQDPVPKFFIEMLTSSFLICVIQDFAIIWRMFK